MFIFIIIIASYMSNEVLADTYYRDSERGWFWYEEPEVEIEKEVTPVAQPQVVEPVLPPREVLREQGKVVEDALATAVMNPTRRNVLDYIQKMAVINKQSSTFSQRFKEALWTNPEYDLTIENPILPQARTASSEIKTKKTRESLEKISAKKGLIYYFRSDCPHCKNFSPILARLADRYGFSVIPVSLDGKGVPEFPFPKTNGQLAQRLKVKIVPAVYLVDPSENKVAAASYGFTDFDTLVKKIVHADETMRSGSA